MTSKPPAVIAQPEIFWLLLGNVRYALGRMSTAPGIAQDAVKKFSICLETNQIQQIQREVAKALAVCDDAREYNESFSVPLRDGIHWLGMESDHRGWCEFARWCETEVATRQAVP